MAFLKSMPVKSTGNSKCLWLDRTWGIQKGDMLTIHAILDGKNYYHTTAAKVNSSKYVTLPKFWPVEVGDIIDVKISYANVPKRPESEGASEDGEDDSETEDA